MGKHKIYTMPFSKVYPLYIAKAEKKGRTKEEVDQIICWLTGYRQEEVEKLVRQNVSVEVFFEEALNFNPASSQIKGVICGIRVEEVQEPIMRRIRYLDKLIDELAKGKPMEKIIKPI
ncbi:DUF2200 domain-containing protein [Vallitaleaceae bacterium 9-2]